jgi:hypothetical protein
MVDGFREMFKVTPELVLLSRLLLMRSATFLTLLIRRWLMVMILSSAASSLREYAASERKTLQAIAKQRDVLAGKIDVARTITAGVTGLVSITNLLETTSKSVTETVSTIINGISCCDY